MENRHKVSSPLICHSLNFHRFTVDKDSGWVTVAGALDRETVDSYVMTAEARDGGGYTTFTNLQINILDENDEAPVFRRDEYFATVKEDSLHFLREPVTVEVIIALKHVNHASIFTYL